MLLSIITPTFNRSYCLEKLYQSLISIGSDEFEWILVDDGSTDNTALLAGKWQEQQSINFRFIKQSNSGKTNAVIRAFDSDPTGKYSLVLDSDDILVPDALRLIKEKLIELQADEIGLSFLKSDTKGQIIGSEFKLASSTYIDLYFGKNRCFGDKLFVINTSVYKNSLVPAYPGEKLIPEGVMYLNMQIWGKFRCINRIIYSGDYLNDGLSNSIIKLAADNINGFILEKRMLQLEPLGFADSIKNDIKYLCYCLAGKKSWKEIFQYSRNKVLLGLLIMPTYILSWRRICAIRNIISEKQLNQK